MTADNFLFRFPYDWKTPIGYLFAWLLQTGSCFYLSIITISSISLYFGLCNFLVASSECSKYHLNEIERQINAVYSQEFENAFFEIKRNLQKINLYYCDSIQLIQTKFTHFCRMNSTNWISFAFLYDVLRKNKEWFINVPKHLL